MNMSIDQLINRSIIAALIMYVTLTVQKNVAVMFFEQSTPKMLIDSVLKQQNIHLCII